MATLQAQTFDGLPGGMNLAIPAHSLDDSEAKYLQDTLLDYPGLVRRRGPVRASVGFPTFTDKGCGIVGTITPAGNYRIGVLTGDSSTGEFQMLSDDFSTVTPFTWNGFLPQSPYYIVDAKPTLLGGATVGTSSQYNSADPEQSLAFWRGGNKADYTTGTLSLTRGSATVTGAGTTWGSNVTSGMFLFADVTDLTNLGKFQATLIGVVKSVESNTSLTLMDVSPYTTSATGYRATSIRGFQYKVVKGRITTSSANTTVTGANTKFISQFMDTAVAARNGTTHTNTILDGLAQTSDLKVGMRVTGTNIAANSYIVSVDSSSQVTLNNATTGSATNLMTFKHAWNIYKASDMSWIGRVSIVNNEISITLAANSTQSLNNEKFVALCGTGDWNLNTMDNTFKVGFLNAFYAGRQWYANNGQKLSHTARVWFSDTADHEGVDLADFDGDFFDVSSSVGTDTPIKALVPAYNGLVVIKENETYAVTGSTPTTFSVKKIQDDGCLSGMSAQPYGGGVIWAGLDGIYFYDGISVTNLSQEKLGDYYRNAVRNVDPSTHRMWGMVQRSHYFLFIESFSPNTSVIKGTLSYTPTALTVVINLETRAFSMFTNLAFRGAVETPSDTGEHTLYVANDGTKANICQGFDLFDVDSNDTFLCDLGIAASVYRYGETSLGDGVSFAGAANTKYFSKITIPTRCAIDTILAYSAGQGGGSGSCNVRAGLYTDNAGAPNTLVAETAAVSLNQADGPAYRTYTFSTPQELAPGDYWIGVHVETSSRVNFYASTDSNALASASDTYSGGLATPFGSPSLSTGPLIAYAHVLTAGPDFYIESKKYTEGDSMHKKLFKQLAINYMVQGDSLRLDTVPGLQNIGKTATAIFPTTVYTWDQLVALFGNWDLLASAYPTWDSLTEANFRPKRIKFLKRSQLMSFRLWQNSPGVSRASLGPFQIAYKWQRLGRI